MPCGWGTHVSRGRCSRDVLAGVMAFYITNTLRQSKLLHCPSSDEFWYQQRNEHPLHVSPKHEIVRLVRHTNIEVKDRQRAYRSVEKHDQIISIMPLTAPFNGQPNRSGDITLSLLIIVMIKCLKDMKDKRNCFTLWRLSMGPSSQCGEALVRKAPKLKIENEP